MVTCTMVYAGQVKDGILYMGKCVTCFKVLLFLTFSSINPHERKELAIKGYAFHTYLANWTFIQPEAHRYESSSLDDRLGNRVLVFSSWETLLGMLNVHMQVMWKWIFASRWKAFKMQWKWRAWSAHQSWF